MSNPLSDYSHAKHEGFALLEALLLLIISGIIGFTGWYVWNSTRNVNASLSQSATNAPAVSQKVDKNSSKSNDVTASWLLYQSPGKEYAIRLADGWSLHRYQKTAALYTFSNGDIAPKSGVAALVQEDEYGKDGSGIGLFLSYAPKDSGVQLAGTAQAPFVTDDGLTVKVYSYTQTGDVTDGLGSLPNGAMDYNYLIVSPAGHIMTISYAYDNGDFDYHKTVEQVIKTLHFNQ